VGGAPVAYTSLRSTYRHEADSAFGFAMFDDPAQMATAAGFQQAAANVGYAFNWFYVNSSQVGYFDSGLNPVRTAGSDPNLPMKADPAYEWQGFDPDTNTATYAPVAQHLSAALLDHLHQHARELARPAARERPAPALAPEHDRVRELA